MIYRKRKDAKRTISSGLFDPPLGNVLSLCGSTVRWRIACIAHIQRDLYTPFSLFVPVHSNIIHTQLPNSYLWVTVMLHIVLRLL